MKEEVSELSDEGEIRCMRKRDLCTGVNAKPPVVPCSLTYVNIALLRLYLQARVRMNEDSAGGAP